MCIVVRSRLCRLGSRCVCEEREIRAGNCVFEWNKHLICLLLDLLGKVYNSKRCLITKLSSHINLFDGIETIVANCCNIKDTNDPIYPRFSSV